MTVDEIRKMDTYEALLWKVYFHLIRVSTGNTSSEDAIDTLIESIWKAVALNHVDGSDSWIPVWEGLPQVDPTTHTSKLVLVRAVDAPQEYLFDRYNESTKQFSHEAQGRYVITHWRPLPELPKGGVPHV